MVWCGSAVSQQVVQLGKMVERVSAVSQQVVQLGKMVWRGSAMSQQVVQLEKMVRRIAAVSQKFKQSGTVIRRGSAVSQQVVQLGKMVRRIAAGEMIPMCLTSYILGFSIGLPTAMLVAPALQHGVDRRCIRSHACGCDALATPWHPPHPHPAVMARGSASALCASFYSHGMLCSPMQKSVPGPRPARHPGECSIRPLHRQPLRTPKPVHCSISRHLRAR